MSDKVYFPPKCGYEAEAGHIRTDGSVMNKVSGTMMSGILGISPWSTPFQVACDLLGVARQDISGKSFIKAGQDLEPVVIDYIGKRYPEKGLFVPASSIYEKREGDHDSWVSDFDSDIFAGHVDGMVMTDDGKNYILEIKTSGNIDAWTEGVPEHYYWQVALYNHFLAKQDKAFVGLGIVNSNTYKDTMSWVPNDRDVMLFEMPIDQDDVTEKLGIIRKWYSDYIEKGITPDYDPNNKGDVEMYEHLVNLTNDVDTVKGLVDEMADVDGRIDAYEQEQDVLYRRRDMLKSNIKTYLDCHDISSLDSATGDYVAILNGSTRSKISKELLQKDGIDVSKYTVKTTTKTFSIKKKKV